MARLYRSCNPARGCCTCLPEETVKGLVKMTGRGDAPMAGIPAPQGLGRGGGVHKRTLLRRLGKASGKIARNAPILDWRAW
jgi:hypothetical protein